MKNKDYQIERLKKREYIKEPKPKEKFDDDIVDNKYIELLIKTYKVVE